jgi:hypothetical protein
MLFSAVLYPILLPRPIRPDQFPAVYLPPISVDHLPTPNHLTTSPSAFSEYKHQERFFSSRFPEYGDFREF